MAEKNSRGFRQVGYSPPDLSVMNEGELEGRRETVARLRDLVGRADQGEEGVVPAIREILDESPDLAWRLRNIGKLAERLLISKLTSGEDTAAKEMMEHQLESMRLEIAGEAPSPLELLLAERVVATWLQVQFFEALYASGLGKHALTQSNYYQKRLDRAHGRHLSAIRTLAQIRKMGPAIQINVAEKQINMAG
ncbi:MAG: hypothetical protein WKF53_06390 [Rubrobacter sp.]